MIEVEFNDGTAFLLDDVINWDVDVDLTVRIPGSIEPGLSAIETRRQTGDTARLSLGFTATLCGPEAVTNLRNSLQALNVQPVLCPLWPAWFQPGETPPMSAPWYVEIGDGAAPVIVAAAALPLTRAACPLMIGRLTKVTNPKLLTAEAADVDYEFTENDDSNLTPPEFAAPNGPAAASGVRPIFPWRHDWASSIDSGCAMVDVDRQQIGELRHTSDAYYTQLARRTSSQAVTLCGADVWDLIAFFVSMGGVEQSFWLGAGMSEALLTANVAATDTTLTVDEPGNIGGNSYILLDDLTNRTAVQVTGTVGSKWTLSAAVGTAYGQENTRLESLWLARFDGATLDLKFFDVGKANASIDFLEVPYETASGEATSGEAVGETYGPMPGNAWVYVFTINYPGGAETFCFTNFERDLTGEQGDATHAEIEHSDITETDSIQRQSVDFKSRNFLGNPLALMVPFTLEFPLMVQIYEVDVAQFATGYTNARCYFYGEMGEGKTDGPYISGTAESLSYILDRQVPRRLYQTGCNWVLFEPKCGLNPANWTWTADVVSWDGQSQLTMGTIASTNGAALTANFFANGYLILGTGQAAQYRMITQSTAVSGGELVLTLSTPLTGVIAVGTALKALPGCDGLMATCQTKYNNFANFGGFPFVPVANPTLMQTASINNGKKQ